MRRVKGYRYLYRRGDQLYFRRRVPAGAIAAFGGREEVQKSLGTSNIADARHLLAIEVATFDKILADLGGRPVADAVRHIVPNKSPSQTELEERVRHWLSERIERAASSELAVSGRDPDEAKRVWLDLQAHADSVKQGIGLGAEGPSITTTWLAEDICSAEGWVIDRGSSLWHHLERLVGRSQIEANSWIAADMNGEARIVQDARFSPDQYRLDDERRRQKSDDQPISIMELFEGYVAERKPAPATIKSYRRFISAFIDFLGHSDARQVRSKDVVAWKKHLLSAPNAQGLVRSAKTVGETYLSAIKTMFLWG
ncbi:site-specific integrase [Altererythrobacter sp. KTW20L]|uniref:DUF6538 domain-containing protein n=1 Tax=Altererythrobacter sp. KTW20L TaxID=2942210 RepID=UPI0020BDD031|nr:DUF6538 domain-containing protein [Altererythrobacter sp. KTW20L]MCL6252320.1 site-specific integrase [Altererythrobacter sp. KTW20L]